LKLKKKSGNTPYIVLGTLSDMKIYIPVLDEQYKIISILLPSDNKIETMDKKILLLKEMKKGLLQQIFI